MYRKRWASRVWLGLLALILLFVSGCQKPAETKTGQGLQVVTSFYPIYALTKEVSGDLNDVRMIQSGAGIHSFEPSANDLAAIERSDLFIYHSSTLEGWAKNIQGKDVVEASAGLDLQKVPGLEDMPTGDGVDEAKLYDPHSWLDPILAGQEAQNIAKALSERDPANQATYQANADKFQAEAEDLVKAYQPKFKAAKQKTFVTQHTAFSYLAQRFGLKQLGIAGISPDAEPSPQQLSEIKEFIDRYQVKTIFTEEKASPKLAQVLAEETGAEIKTLRPLEADPENDLSFLENLEADLKTLLEELE
ncbi:MULTISPECIES: metal ABC transporter solute-binding protein, Zn/Mn family [Aerococcus]|uniref:Adhesion protein n=1 Tax=Aerococcus sanguinicola TaxID=119206 RepID=A0A5N1GFH2_9LACT|nr:MULTISPECIES: zinc ABC transporter substrate-binding protein [Aerococcus]KAA9299633.1 adhesion protein [Aerococcus sanguinicola]MDK6369978.1 zinc ABC transporter substrate-binding protein [Aerococcus sp. UMB9870]MDK6680548.1 zinc ABC transporter substrate-binding protein [Aerococcus sp. UMB8608]MDK6687378.1 zinc ABC transporter substrate-binding protein [Aerococcus sp. UMB8623]MDK6940501.1 zinc ABC transporter substrate-binding protein [Aerococcus sp. UMB8487]